MFVFLFIVAYLGGWALSALSTMICVGILHNDWWSFIPPMGYETALAVSLLPFTIAFIMGIINNSSSSS